MDLDSSCFIGSHRKDHLENLGGSHHKFSTGVLPPEMIFKIDLESEPHLLEDYQDYYPYLRSFDNRRFDWELSIRRSRLCKQLEQMAQYSPGRRLIDVGAGPGYLCRIATESGWSSIGIEISDEARRFGSQRFGVEYAELEDLPEHSFDCVTCHHTQEDLSKDNADQAKPCSECHLEPEDPDTPKCSEMSLKKNHFHINCVDCHKEQEKGPAKCNDCHPRD